MSPFVGAIINMSLSSGMFFYAFLYFLIGFFTYAFVYAAAGSTVGRPEDERTVVMIPTLLFVAAFLVSFTGMMAPGQTYVKICSYIPFISPMVMFMRICVADVSAIEIIIGTALNIVYLLGAGWVSTKIYRVGIMLYGTTPKLKDIIRYIREA